MITRLRFLTLSLILLSASSAFGQAEARLFTVLGPTANCELMQAQFDGWFVELQSDPNAGGTIVTYRDRAKPLDAFFRETMIKRYLATRRMDGRVSLIQGESRPELRTEIWTVPAGASDPRIVRADWSYDLSGLTGPLKFGSTGQSDMAECENYDFELLVKFLAANPSMTVKAVIKETGTAKYRAAVKEYGDALAGKRISRNRLTASYVRVARGRYLESKEFWLVPATMIKLTPNAEIPQNADRIPGNEPSGDERITPSVVSGGVINGKATLLPKPAYPAAARAVKASGAVNVEVLVDEQGNVVSAAAVSGHPLLRSAAVNAAKGAKFGPLFPEGPPVKFKGILVFNFVP